jgi:hypothetical protein
MKRVRLAALAEVIRSKNAGPFELTFDVVFPGIISRDMVARLYRLPLDYVLHLVFVPAARAFKATIVRPVPSGDIGDTDVYGAQQHAPWLDVEIPLPEEKDEEVDKKDHHHPYALGGEDDAKG